MSHITAVSGMIFIPKDQLVHLLHAVENFCPDCELIQGESHYRTWKDDHGGKLVGDWPLPDGWTEAMVGEGAHHVIRVTDEAMKKKFGGRARNSSGGPYEIGVVPVRVERDANGKVIRAVPDQDGEEYVLMTDWYANGNGVLNMEGIGQRHMGNNPQTGESTEISFGDLYQAYRMEQAKAEAEMQGDTIAFEKHKDGTYTAQVDTVARIGS